jgi:rfaE bifunctional protein kinase chain/domain
MTNNRILVVGDVMLDKYIMGDTTRISPEAPIPIVLQKELNESPGGAANLSHNLMNLGLKVDMLAGVGKDNDGDTLQSLCENIGIGCHFVETNGYTITKTRIISRNQQMLRVDFEAQSNEYSILSEVPAEIDIKNYSLVIISDYGKGFCNGPLITNIIQRCKMYKIPVYIDPKGSNWSKYQGASLIKPNLTELEEFLSLKILPDQTSLKSYYHKISSLDISYLVISRAADGITLIGKDVYFHHAAPSIEVYDVSGAGDTVMAIFAYGYINNLTLDETVHLATLCGSYVVTKSKTYAITLQELETIKRNASIH